MKIIGYIIAIMVIVGGIYFYLTGDRVSTNTNEEVLVEEITDTESAEQNIPIPSTAQSCSIAIPDVLERYTLVSQETRLAWTGSSVVGARYSGLVNVSEGCVHLSKEGQFIGGEFIIDMQSIVSSDDNAKLIEHLSNEDFFNVPRYPTARIVLDDAIVRDIPGEEGSAYLVSGDLTILDTTRPVQFEAHVKDQNGTVVLEANFPLDRTEWGITYGSGKFFSNLGDRAIVDAIDFALTITLVKE